MSKNSIQKTLLLVAYCFWAVGVFIFVSFGVVGLAAGYILPDAAVEWLSTPLGGLILTAFVYMLTTVIVVLPLKLRGRVTWRQLTEKVGLSESFKLPMLPWAVYVWGLYLVSSVAVVLLLSLLLPELNLAEQQNVGFGGLSGFLEYLAAFLALVVLAPLFEEIIFRGYLFGRLRRLSGFWTSAILTSLIFAVIHLQLNVGIDVFVLSLFLCFLREKFDSIWPTVLVHAIKNGLAFTLLFILPLYGIKLVQ